MKSIVYVYILDTMADWELGYITAAINTAASYNQTTPVYSIQTVSLTKEPILTLGDLTIIPDCSIDEINERALAALLLPGANTWNEAKHQTILHKAEDYLNAGILVAAICGATLALADLGLLNTRLHTSNSKEFLTTFSSHYTGGTFYQNTLAVTDSHLITASSAGSLLWAKQIMDYLDVLPKPMLEAWYNYHATGDPKYYTELMTSTQ
ncbi:hypothetical protein IGL98_003069 [Enterococcus sp. DIV0840]|uniref:DJ-1/PfpI family protein n=1 Tax=unclassified Enterococcus TaxID=2608891 RepID=UPI001A8C4CBB|nr:DJ-1/PfpI family protein [Enterococcus sp. DIV0849a]MBO0435991.1 DJ-1/PfpI family protein [Enterococcus sp. DIV0849a]